MVLDVPLGGQHERLRGLTRLEVRDVLRDEGVQPGEPVRPGDSEHVAMRQVHDAAAGGEGPLLGVRVAVVPGDG